MCLKCTQQVAHVGRFMYLVWPKWRVWIVSSKFCECLNLIGELDWCFERICCPKIHQDWKFVVCTCANRCAHRLFDGCSVENGNVLSPHFCAHSAECWRCQASRHTTRALWECCFSCNHVGIYLYRYCVRVACFDWPMHELWPSCACESTDLVYRTMDAMAWVLMHGVQNSARHAIKSQQCYQ